MNDQLKPTAREEGQFYVDVGNKIRELEAQLAAEQDWCQHLRIQLAAEVEKVNKLQQRVALLGETRIAVDQAELLSLREKVNDLEQQLQLAAEKKASIAVVGSKINEIRQLQEQLATVVEALKNMRFTYPVNTEMAKLIDAALAKVGETMNKTERNDLKCQLAAERERNTGALPYKELEDLYRNALTQLAAEREKVKKLEWKLNQDSQNFEIECLKEQLAAEKEKYARSQEKVREYFDLLADERKASIAVVGSKINEIRQLKEQLAADRERTKTLVDTLKVAKRHLEATTQALGEFTTSDDVAVLIQIDAALAAKGR